MVSKSNEFFDWKRICHHSILLQQKNISFFIFSDRHFCRNVITGRERERVRENVCVRERVRERERRGGGILEAVAELKKVIKEVESFWGAMIVVPEEAQLPHDLEVAGSVPAMASFY